MFKLFFKLREADRFQPDFFVDEGYDFAKYRFDTKVFSLPGRALSHAILWVQYYPSWLQ